jgi:hypothetical protein
MLIYLILFLFKYNNYADFRDFLTRFREVGFNVNRVHRVLGIVTRTTNVDEWRGIYSATTVYYVVIDTNIIIIIIYIQVI